MNHQRQKAMSDFAAEEKKKVKATRLVPLLALAGFSAIVLGGRLLKRDRQQASQKTQPAFEPAEEFRRYDTEDLLLS